LDDTTRRTFLKTTALASAAAAAGPADAEAPAAPLVLGLVGCAHIHVPGFAKLLAERKDVRVKWAWDPDPARVARWGGVVGARTASSPAEVMGDPEVKGVVVLSETDRHRELVGMAAAAKKHPFVEKPL
jgi:predicted dehydrogenase